MTNELLVAREAYGTAGLGANQAPPKALGTDAEALPQRTMFTTSWLGNRRLNRQKVSSTKDMVR